MRPFFFHLSSTILNLNNLEFILLQIITVPQNHPMGHVELIFDL
jgi:hypothetical protein